MFCKTVWNGLHILPDGYIRLCSIGSNSVKELDMQRCRDKDGKVMHILTHDIIDIMNSDKHREVRLANLQNPQGWSPHCKCCLDREIVTNFNRKHLNRSRRIYLMNIDSDNVVNEHNFQNVSSDGTINYMPSSLDIRFGNLCNQKCIMCNPTFSNLWYDDFYEYYKELKFGQGIMLEAKKDESTGKWIQPQELKWYEDPRWWPKFEQMAPHLRHIYITGGEPMVTPAHDEMLDRLIERGYAKNIWLEYDTNLSTINNKITSRWKNFNKVHLRGSMDSAIPDQYEIIRFGGKWEKFVNNVGTIKQLESETNGKVKLLALSTCFQISTCLSIPETEEWCKKIGTDFHLRFLEGPRHHSVEIMNRQSKLDLIDYYEKHKECSKSTMIINYLKKSLDIDQQQYVHEFVKFMNYLDTRRNTDWKNIFSEVNTLLNKNYVL